MGIVGNFVHLTVINGFRREILLIVHQKLVGNIGEYFLNALFFPMSLHNGRAGEGIGRAGFREDNFQGQFNFYNNIARQAVNGGSMSLYIVILLAIAVAGEILAGFVKYILNIPF